RRCMHAIARADNNQAQTILERVFRVDFRTAPLEDELTEVAELLLCARYHQDQAERVMQGWRKKSQEKKKEKDEKVVMTEEDVDAIFDQLCPELRDIEDIIRATWERRRQAGQITITGPVERGPPEMHLASGTNRRIRTPRSNREAVPNRLGLSQANAGTQACGSSERTSGTGSRRSTEGADGTPDERRFIDLSRRIAEMMERSLDITMTSENLLEIPVARRGDLLVDGPAQGPPSSPAKANIIRPPTPEPVVETKPATTKLAITEDSQDDSSCAICLEELTDGTSLKYCRSYVLRFDAGCISSNTLDR
ncbi:MAG: hypothetical protein Q9174_006674, partial [Haloplaca sp. 1 TL-2023]